MDKSKMSMILNIIKNHFSFFCSRFDAELVKEEIDAEAQGVFVTYITKYSGVRVSYELTEGGIFIMIFPLHNNKIPEYKYWYEIRDYFQSMGVKFNGKEITNTINPNIEELEIAFKYFADSVEPHIQPFLKGDFSKISIMDEIIRKRAESM